MILGNSCERVITPQKDCDSQVENCWFRTSVEKNATSDWHTASLRGIFWLITDTGRPNLLWSVSPLGGCPGEMQKQAEKPWWSRQQGTILLGHCFNFCVQVFTLSSCADFPSWWTKIVKMLLLVMVFFYNDNRNKINTAIDSRFMGCPCDRTDHVVVCVRLGLWKDFRTLGRKSQWVLRA